MKIHVLSTVNGQENEGMRNVATHIAKCLEAEHTVMYSGLKQFSSIAINAVRADVTMVFARANKQVYWLMRMVEKLCKNVWLVCVQKPNDEFIKLNSAVPLNCNYLSLLESDLRDVVYKKNRKGYCFSLGINEKKFCPVSAERQQELKEKYGFSNKKRLAVHVGHCSSGRGLEDFVELDDSLFDRLVVASGMFEDPNVTNRLENAGVHVLRGYQEHVEEIYQMADVYLFPTKSCEYVISIPLSVMEALACGTPVVGYKTFPNLKEISGTEEAILCVDSVAELNHTVLQQAKMKAWYSLLADARTWEQTTESILRLMERVK